MLFQTSGGMSDMEIMDLSNYIVAARVVEERFGKIVKEALMVSNNTVERDEMYVFTMAILAKLFFDGQIVLKKKVDDK